jgi:predicted TIM-barrel fold metal-dependent hydrolase
MPRIDSDAHVVEAPCTWSYLREEEKGFRPLIYERVSDDGAPANATRHRQYWKIGDHFHSKSNIGENVPAAARDMVDIQLRLGHMDETGVDVQVLYPTVFLEPITTEHDVEFALVRSYNRWLAEIWGRSSDRLRWVAVPPLLSLIDPGKVRAELEFCKENGACGIFMRGMECELLVSHRYFFPLYEMAQSLDLPICFHAGNNSFTYFNSFARDARLSVNKTPVVAACYHLLADDVPKRFPGLRWAFVEATAQWVPYILNVVKIRYTELGKRLPDDLLSKSNFYITTQRTDDLDWLLDEIGDDNLLIGTDYGHRDNAVEIEALRRLENDGTLPPSSAKKILQSNPGTLYSVK